MERWKGGRADEVQGIWERGAGNRVHLKKRGGGETQARREGGSKRVY